jgi:hypothetical protein
VKSPEHLKRRALAGTAAAVAATALVWMKLRRHCGSLVFIGAGKDRFGFAHVWRRIHGQRRSGAEYCAALNRV